MSHFLADHWSSKWALLTTPTGQWQHSDTWLNKPPRVWPAWDQGFNEFWLIEFILLSNWLTCFVFYRVVSAFGVTAANTLFSGSCWKNNHQPNIFPKMHISGANVRLWNSQVGQQGVDWGVSRTRTSARLWNTATSHCWRRMMKLCDDCRILCVSWISDPVLTGQETLLSWD